MNTTPNSQTNQVKASVTPPKVPEITLDMTPKREQLRHRVEARIKDLEGSLGSLKSQPGNAERCRGLETELQLAKDCTAGGWDKVGEVEAAKLAQWLEGTQSVAEKVVPSGATVPGQVENAMEDGRTTVESSRPATDKPRKMPQA